MYSHSDDELGAALAALTRRRRLQLQHTRCLKIARACFGAGLAGVIFLCVWGMKPSSVAVPSTFAVVAFLFGATSAGLFARAARRSLEDAGPDTDEDDRGPGGGGEDPREPTGGGNLEFEWERFEREFRSYCDRVPAGHAG